MQRHQQHRPAPRDLFERKLTGKHALPPSVARVYGELREQRPD